MAAVMIRLKVPPDNGGNELWQEIRGRCLRHEYVLFDYYWKPDGEALF